MSLKIIQLMCVGFYNNKSWFQWINSTRLLVKTLIKEPLRSLNITTQVERLGDSLDAPLVLHLSQNLGGARQLTSVILGAAGAWQVAHKNL